MNGTSEAEGRHRRVILHIGQTKAGSTAIQNYLENQRTALMQRGLLFPAEGFARVNPFDPERTAGHLELMRKVAQKGDLTGLEREIELSGAETLIISAENLLMDRPDDMLQGIGRYFDDWQVLLLAVLRSLPGWLNSRYVEDCLSGFNNRTRSFAEFCADAVAQGTHDYAARLDRLSNLLGADQIRVINYDAAMAGPGLVPAFLETTGLPMTDDALARDIRANVREKEWFLVEGKRRVNHVSQGVSLAARLELEAEMRKRAREISSAMPSQPPVFWVEAIPLSAQTCIEVAESNARLVQDFGLSPPLEDPKPGILDGRPHRYHYEGIDELVTFGLTTAARLFQNESFEASSASGAFPLLANPGSETLVDILSNAKTSLHLDTPDAALLGACYNGKRSFLVTAEEDGNKHIDRFVSMKLPSEIIQAGYEDGPFPEFERWAGKNAGAIEVMVASGSVDPKRLHSWWRFAGRHTQLCLLGQDVSEIHNIAVEFDLTLCKANRYVYVLACDGGAARKMAQ